MIAMRIPLLLRTLIIAAPLCLSMPAVSGCGTDGDNFEDAFDQLVDDLDDADDDDDVEEAFDDFFEDAFDD